MGLFGTKLFDTGEKNKISEIAEILKGIFSRVRCKLAIDEIEIRFKKLIFIETSKSRLIRGYWVPLIPNIKSTQDSDRVT